MHALVVLTGSPCCSVMWQSAKLVALKGSSRGWEECVEPDDEDVTVKLEVKSPPPSLIVLTVGPDEEGVI